MKQYKWPELVKAYNACPDIGEDVKDFISMKGALNFEIPHQKLLPDTWYQQTAEMERRLTKAFGGLEIIGEENENVPYPEYQGILRYVGYFCGMKNGCAKFRMDIGLGSGQTPKAFFSRFMTFFGVFPLGEYKAQTDEALRELWEYILGFDSVFPPRGDSPIPAEKCGNQSILLRIGREPIASGQYALREAGLSVEPKKTILMTEGLMI
jgi:hypothetical protein